MKALNRVVDAVPPLVVAIVLALVWRYVHIDLGHSTMSATAAVALAGYICIPVTFILVIVPLIITDTTTDPIFDERFTVALVAAGWAGTAGLAAFATLEPLDWPARTALLIGCGLVIALSTAVTHLASARTRYKMEPWLIRKLLLPVGVYLGAIVATTSNMTAGATVLGMFVGAQLLWTLLRRSEYE